MLSLDLFNTHYEKKLHEGAVDSTIEHLLKPLSLRAADIRTQLRNGRLDSKQIAKLEKEYEDLVQKRLDIILDRQPKNEQQVPSKQDPFAYVKPEPKGIGDIQDPRTKMASLAQKARKGPLANVGAGLKGFLTGKEEPIDEEEQPQLGRRGIGMANMKSLQATVEKGFARTIFQFPNMKYVVGEDDTDKMADYYNALDSAGRTNFVYNVLGDGMKFIQMCKELGITADPVEPKQPELPGITPQGELPLSERQDQKKKSKDDITAGDVKTAREIQKIRAQYPAARSDIEALARAEIDSAERSQQQIGRLRSANTKQDELLKQIMDLDREQSKEIDALDNENDSLEQQLARVQGLNDRLTQTVAQMTGAQRPVAQTAQRQAQRVAAPTIDLIPDAPADQAKPSVAQPMAKAEPATDQTKASDKTAAPISPSAKVIQLPKFSPPERLVKAQKVSGSDITEGVPQDAIQRYLAIDAETDVEAVKKAIQAIHRDPALSAKSKARLLSYIFALVRKHRLHIGRAYYQFLQQYLEEGWSDKYNPTPHAVYIDGRQWKTFRTNDEARAVADKVQANLKRQGREQTVTIAPSKDVKETFDRPGTTIPRKSLIQGYTVYFNPSTKIISVTRGGDSEEAAVEQAKIGTVNMKTFRQATERMIDKIEELAEAKEIITKKDFLDRRDYLLRKIDADPNPVNRQIIRAEIRKLESQAEAEGWISPQQRLVREDSSTSSEAAERAILNRIMVDDKLRNMALDIGMDKVLQAVEDVAYDLGDLDEIGTSDVSGWVRQVEQILGVPEELDEKWSAKYKRSINCAKPKGFSQRAHCQGRKK